MLLLTSLCDSTPSEADFDGTAGCSADLLAAAGGTCILGRPCICGRPPEVRRWCPPSWTNGGETTSYSWLCCRCSGGPWYAGRPWCAGRPWYVAGPWCTRGPWRRCAGGPWCREALDAACGKSSFHGNRRRTGFGWRGSGGVMGGTSGVAAPSSRAVSQFV